MFALLNNTRVVVSTNTINLQDQLIKKDIPDLCAALGLESEMQRYSKGVPTICARAAWDSCASAGRVMPTRCV